MKCLLGCLFLVSATLVLVVHSEDNHDLKATKDEARRGLLGGDTDVTDVFPNPSDTLIDGYIEGDLFLDGLMKRGYKYPDGGSKDNSNDYAKYQMGYRKRGYTKYPDGGSKDNSNEYAKYQMGYR